MNFLPIAIGGAIIATIALGSVIKIWRSERKKKETTVVVASVIAGAGTKKDGEKKLTFGQQVNQQVKRWWFIIIFGIPITFWLFSLMWSPVFQKFFPGVYSSQKTFATMLWWKDESVYGNNPRARRGGPYDVEILRCDKKIMAFNVYYLSRPNGSFKGEIELSGKFSGTWSQSYPEADGGNWYLVQNLTNLRLFEGKYTDKSGAWINFSLKIDPK